MTIYRKTIYALLAVLLTAHASCNKLDLAPSDSIDPTKAFRNVTDLNMGLLGAYALLDYTLMGISVIVSDEAMLPTENTVSNTDAHRWIYNAGSGSVTGAFSEYYSIIDRANRALAALDNVQAASSNEVALKERYHGELLAIRAYSHFELLRAYASAYENGALGIPYMKVSEIGTPARAPFESVIQDIKTDLQAAKPLIPVSFNDKSRITRNAVSAIQARVALYEQNWSEAITYASEVIDREPLADREAFAGMWVDEADDEVVWKLKRVLGDSRFGGFFFRESGDIVLYAPAFKMINQFDAGNDIRFSSYIAHEPGRGEGKAEYLVKKYVGGDSEAPGLTDIKVFRTGEMYLIRAEAKAESETLESAVADLNTLRRTRIDGYADETITSKEALINAIYTERYKELAFEGHRFFDLKRRKLAVERLPEDAINTSGAIRLDPDQAQYALPIPALEISVNKNMEQNPNY